MTAKALINGQDQEAEVTREGYDLVDPENSYVFQHRAYDPTMPHVDFVWPTPVGRTKMLASVFPLGARLYTWDPPSRCSKGHDVQSRAKTKR